jgi:CRP/FNR family transcriptional regulator
MALLDRFPAMERRLLCMASHEIREDHEQMLLLGRKTALERVASFLRQQARRAARFGGSGDVAALPMTRTDIADYLGVTPETVSRVLSQLRARGVISLRADAAQILKPAALAALAEGETAPAA